MERIQKVAIIGVGLIGGSLARAWQLHCPDIQLWGYDRSEQVLEEARKEEIIDETAETLGQAVKKADVVVLATPVRVLPNIFDQTLPHLQNETVITDVGSVKTPIAQHARDAMDRKILFVGGHPMAGAEESGISHTDALLFENATYVLCPPESLSEEEFLSTYDHFVDLIRATGARIRLLSPEKHDLFAATVSHLPQLLSVALMNEALHQDPDNEAALQLAAGGFRDMTRIASSPFSMWEDIFQANRPRLLNVLTDFIRHLEEHRTWIRDGSMDELAYAFKKARDTREEIPRDTKGFLHPLADIYVWGEDRPGFLAQLTQVIYDADINIKDIELLKIREGTGGAFRMGFDDEETAEQAVTVLQEAGYTAYRL